MGLTPTNTLLPMVVCDGWTEPRHPRIILKDGDPTRTSHGMCEACEQQLVPVTLSYFHDPNENTPEQESRRQADIKKRVR